MQKTGNDSGSDVDEMDHDGTGRPGQRPLHARQRASGLCFSSCIPQQSLAQISYLHPLDLEALLRGWGLDAVSRFIITQLLLFIIIKSSV